MIAVQVVSLPYTGDFLCQGCRSTTSPDEVSHNRGTSTATMLRTAHQGNLCGGPVQGPSADGVTLRRVGIEKRFGGRSIHGCGELPAQVDGISNAEVKPLAADGCKDMSSVSR